MHAYRVGVIKFVRKYEAYNHTWYDVIYSTGRAFTFIEADLPKTVVNFIRTATKRTEQYDRTSPRKNKYETIYEA